MLSKGRSIDEKSLFMFSSTDNQGCKQPKDTGGMELQFLLQVSRLLSDKEMQHLLFLCKDVVLSTKDVRDIHAFPDLVQTLEKKKGWKVTKDMQDYQVLCDILRIIRRKDISKKIKDYGKKRDKPTPKADIFGTALTPLFCDGSGQSGDDGQFYATSKDISLTEFLQKGHYSDFRKGTIPGREAPVMVEVYKCSRSSDVQQSFAAQGDIQCSLSHENIVKVLSVLRNVEPPWIVLEWMPEGDLLTFLRSSHEPGLSIDQLVRFATQICSGMSYMEEKSYAHCNLKANSVFVAKDRTVKVGGFCLAMKLRAGQPKLLDADVFLPIRWSDLDVVRFRKVTNKSDVWSFGILLVEIFSKGELPYPDMEPKEIVSRLRQGYRHPRPDECPEDIYQIMDCCWNPEDRRPSFKDILPYLKEYRKISSIGDNPKFQVALSGSDNPKIQLAHSGSFGRRDAKRLHGPPPGSSTVQMRRPAQRLSSYALYIKHKSDYLAVMNTDEIPDQLKDSKRNTLLPADLEKLLELPREEVELEKEIGNGAFGEVWKAKLSGTMDVAVKMFIPTRMEPQQFLQEAEMMKKFNHEHIVRLIGVCTEGPPIYIVTEFMEKGNLLEYLREDGGQTLSRHQLLDYAAQVADAMTNVEALKCIHRDIAARNVLVSDMYTVKLADFGLSRTVISSYYRATSAADQSIPARWTSPEYAKTRNYTIKSDVWSFGILLVEIMTFGEIPYADMNNNEVLEQVTKGYKHPQPVDPFNCPDEIYEVMISCWRLNPEKRPSFQELFKTMKNLVEVYKNERVAVTNSNSPIPNGIQQGSSQYRKNPTLKH